MNVKQALSAKKLRKFQVNKTPAAKSEEPGAEPTFPKDSSRLTLSLPAVTPEPLAAVSMDFDLDKLRVKPGEKVDLNSIDTSPPKGVPHKKKDAKRILDAMLERITDLQRKLFSENKESIVFVVQGMDNSGKGGTFKKIFAPLAEKHESGIQRANFKAPSKEERDHDFLWRINHAMPPKGNIALFDRSHYEDIVEVRVSNLAPEEVWKQRNGIVRDYESMKGKMGTKFVKLFLHISKDEQKERLEDRRATPHKQYKFSADDVARREHWGEYMEAYGDALSETSTKEAPWYVIPADDKDARNLMIAGLLLKTLEDMDPKYPKLPDNLVTLPIE